MAAEPATTRAAPPAGLSPEWAFVARATAVVTLLGAAAVHASVIDAHFREWAPEGVFFIVLLLVEASLAVVLTRSATRPPALVAVVASLATAAVWVVSRTTGVPLGPHAWEPEPIGRADVVATLLELTTAGALLPLVLPQPGRVGRRAVAAVVAAGVGGATIFGLLAANGAHDDRLAAGGEHGEARPGIGRPPRLIDPVEGRPVIETRALGPFRLVLGVGPASAGINTVDVIVSDSGGQRVDLQRVRISARRDGARWGLLRLRPVRLAPGHYIVDAARLGRAGRWLFRVEARRGAAALAQTIAVPIRARR